MLDICLLGTGGMHPLPHRFLTSLYVKCGSRALLIDCGESTQTAMRCAGCSFKAIDLICITHLHGDHVNGLNGLLLSMALSGRTEPVIVTGPQGLYQILSGLLITVPGLPFPLQVRELPAEPGGEPCHAAQLDSLSIKGFPSEHRIPCLGYRLEVPRQGKFMPEIAKALGIPVSQWALLQRGQTVRADGRTISPADVLGPARKGLKLLYATDTHAISSISDLGQDADLLILEGLYGDETLRQKAFDRGHMTMLQAAQLAKDAGAAELWLTHYSPSVADPLVYQDAVSRVFPGAVMGRDGMKKTLRFQEFCQ